MGGRGSMSMSASLEMGSSTTTDVQSLLASLLKDDMPSYRFVPGRGRAIEAQADVSSAEADLMYDAVQIWANGSNGIKTAEKGQTSDPALLAAMQYLHKFEDVMPAYSGEIVRVLSGSHSYEYKKGGKIYSDGSTTSWTVPPNLANAINGFGNENSSPVVLHVSTTKGIDTRGISWLTAEDQEILQKGGYDGSLTITKVTTRTEKSTVFPKGRKVTHVYLKE